MKALVKYAAGEGNLDIMDVPEPECGEGQVKVEVAFCGVCGTDLHVMHDTFRNYPPVILGHEIAGTVVETGRGVSGVAPGTRVTILGATAVTCRECRYCRAGQFILCSHRRGMGHGVNGGFARFIVVRPDQLYRIPDTFGLDEAAMSEPFAAAVQAVTEVTQARLGDTVLVSGPGPIGLLCLKLLVSEGIKTIVAGACGDDARLNAAKEIGATIVVNTSAQNLCEVVRAETGSGVDAALECAGHPASVRGCLEALRPLGRYTQVAICGREIQVPLDQMIFKQLTLTGSMCYTAETWDRMLRIYAQGHLRLKDLISTRLPITEWRTGFDLCAAKAAIKVLLHPVA
jgi:L-iditol 2-dehydrogenase